MGPLPLALLIVLEEYTPGRCDGCNPLLPLQQRRYNRVQNTRRSINFVDGRLKVVHALVLHGQLNGLFVVDPPCVHRSHVDQAGDVVLRAGTRHHVESSLGHVGVRVVLALIAVEFSLHCTYVDDELPRRGVALHANLQSSIDDRRRHGVDGQNFSHFVCGHLVQTQHPAVLPAQVNLLPIDVTCALGEEQRIVHVVASDDDCL
jgi:hypothetical protein